MAHTFGNFEILSCRVYQTSSMIPCWLYIMLDSRWLLPFRLRLMLPSQQALSPTFQLLLLPLSADLFRLYLTSPVLVDNSFDVFTDLFPRSSHSIGFYQRFWVLHFFCRLFWFLVPTLLGTPPGLVWCFFLDARMGGVSLSVILE
jgi:hypothetical protein